MGRTSYLTQPSVIGSALRHPGLGVAATARPSPEPCDHRRYGSGIEPYRPSASVPVVLPGSDRARYRV